MSTPSNSYLEALGKRALLAVAVVGLACVAASCGESPTNVPVDPSLAVRAAGQASAVQQVVEGQTNTAAVQAPFSTAAGDLESLGEVGLGADDLAEYGHAGTILAKACRDLGTETARFGTEARLAAWRQDVRATKRVTAADSCVTEIVPGVGTRTVCIATTAQPNVVRVTITLTSPFETVTRTEQVFTVDTNGTPAVSDDDHILDYHSQVRLRDGTTVDVDMSPHVAGPILDQSVVDVVEVVRPAQGVVMQQTNTIAMNVGVVADSNDDRLLDLNAAVDFRDGASAALHVDDLDPADGIADGDELGVTASFTAAPSNPWLETVSSTVGILVHQLATEDDDQVSALARTTVFDGVTASGGSPGATTTFVPAAPVGRGEEPCGGHFERHAAYPVSWERRTLDLVIDRSCGGGGTSTLDVTFADASSTHGTTTWDASGNATCNTTRRDGAVVTGTYTAADHRLVVDTVYPEGRDPGSEHLEASADPVGQTADLLVTRTHVGGSTDSFTAHVVGNDDGTETITGTAVDARGTTQFTMELDRRTRTVTGSSQGPDDESLTYALVPHAEVGGWFLTFRFRDPSEDLTVVGAILVDGDGSGCGTLTISQHGGTTTVPVCFAPGGGGKISTTSGEIPF